MSAGNSSSSSSVHSNLRRRRRGGGGGERKDEEKKKTLKTSAVFCGNERLLHFSHLHQPTRDKHQSRRFRGVEIRSGLVSDTVFNRVHQFESSFIIFLIEYFFVLLLLNLPHFPNEKKKKAKQKYGFYVHLQLKLKNE